MPVETKLLVPGLLGFSLVTVTALVIYYISKKDEDEEKTQGNSVKTSRVHVIEVQVPKKVLPALIGRNGSNIKELQVKTGTSISFKKKEGSEPDICIIRGRTEAAQLAETLVHEFINNQPDIEEETMVVPHWSCGKIIGSGGVTINEISHRSGAKVRLDGTGEIKIVHIKGTKQQIISAKEMVEKEIAHAKCRREISSSRNPRVSTPESPKSNSQLNSRSTPERATPPREQIGVSSPGKQNGSVDGESEKKSSPSSAVSGGSLDVMVSAVASPSRFWIQLVGPQVSQLDALVQQMTDYYENERNRELHKLSSVREGSIVASIFRVDGRWYRGRVARILDPSETDNSPTPIADIFFVDYGDSEYVSVSELYELRADFLKLKFQALECFLAGIKPAKVENARKSNEDDQWDTRAIDHFERLTQAARWKTLVSKTMTYREKGGVNSQNSVQIPGVKLYDVSEDKTSEIDIGDVLIAEGWAVSEQNVAGDM